MMAGRSKLPMTKKIVVFCQLQKIFCIVHAPPKHVAIGMVVHLLTRSEELLTTLNRLGHCIALTQVLEIDTVLA